MSFKFYIKILIIIKEIRLQILRLFVQIDYLQIKQTKVYNCAAHKSVSNLINKFIEII